MAFILVDLLAPGCLDGLDMNQVAGFADQVPFLGGAVLDDHDPLEVDAEVLDPFLNSLLNSRVEPFQTDLISAAVLVGPFEFFLRWLDRSLSHIETVHELSCQHLDVVCDGNPVSIPLRECGPVDIRFLDQDDFGLNPTAASGVSNGGFCKVK